MVLLLIFLLQSPAPFPKKKKKKPRGQSCQLPQPLQLSLCAPSIRRNMGPEHAGRINGPSDQKSQGAACDIKKRKKNKKQKKKARGGVEGRLKGQKFPARASEIQKLWASSSFPTFGSVKRGLDGEKLCPPLPDSVCCYPPPASPSPHTSISRI